MKQLEVQIMGQSYLLGCPEGGEQRMLEAVEKVDYRDVQDPRCRQGEGARPHRGAGRAEPGFRRGRAQPLPAAPAPPASRRPTCTAKNGNGNGAGTSGRPAAGRPCCNTSTARWATTAACSEGRAAQRACDSRCAGLSSAALFPRCQDAFCSNVAAAVLRPTARRNPLQCKASAVRAGLYISLNQCSLSPGLEHRLASVIVSRQMNPTPS